MGICFYIKSQYNITWQKYLKFTIYDRHFWQVFNGWASIIFVIGPGSSESSSQVLLLFVESPEQPFGCLRVVFNSYYLLDQLRLSIEKSQLKIYCVSNLVVVSKNLNSFCQSSIYRKRFVRTRKANLLKKHYNNKLKITSHFMIYVILLSIQCSSHFLQM